ncbi:MAG: hypothetical protein AAF843_17075 [Bacteroidota bacterium]
MSKSVLFLGGLTIAGLYIWNTVNATRNFAEKLTVKIKSIGMPKLTAGLMSIPLELLIVNNQSIGVNVESGQLAVNILQDDGSYFPIGQAQTLKPTRLAAHSSVVVPVSFMGNFSSFSPIWGGGDFSSILDKIFGGTLATLKIDWRVRVHGAPLSGSEIKKISI